MCQNSLSHSTLKFSVIHTFSAYLMSFHQEVFLLEDFCLFRIRNCVSFIQSARTASVRVIFSLACPVVLTSAEFDPLASVVVLVGIPKRVAGISISLPVCPKV